MVGKSAKAFERLGQEGFYSPLAVEERQREHLEKAQDLLAQQATVASLLAAVHASEMRLAQIGSRHRRELLDERALTQSDVRRLTEENVKAVHRLSQLALRAPAAGLVKDLATHTIGAIVAPGTVMLSLVPREEPLLAEVMVRNEDVGFVREGQHVKLKLAAFPFQKYGMVEGQVTHIGPDAQTAQDANAPASDGARGAQPDYRALVQLRQQFLQTGSRRFPLTSGMQVVAELHQGHRSVASYLLSPVQKVWHEAGRER